MQRTIIVLSVLAAILGGCSDKNKEAQLQDQNRQLAEQMKAKDQFIEDVTSSISEIHDKLDVVWAKEKRIMRQASSHEGGKTLTPAELKKEALSRIADIASMLNANRRRISSLQKKISSQTSQYTGLQKMVDDLNTELQEREKSVAELQERVQSLEQKVTEQTETIAAKDKIIDHQQYTVFVVTGDEHELKDKGLIEDEGGFPWGLFGSTTVLADNFSDEEFHPMDKRTDTIIDVPGEIEEIVPRRSEGSYEETKTADGHTALHILEPDVFWRQNHLVVVASKPAQ